MQCGQSCHGLQNGIFAVLSPNAELDPSYTFDGHATARITKRVYIN